MDLDAAANALICDPATLLHWNHVRDGSSGDWLDEATPRQTVILDRMCGPWLMSRGYPPAPQAADAPGERSGIELAILRGWLSFRLRGASQRFPRLAAIARKSLGLKNPAEVGAKVWS